MLWVKQWEDIKIKKRKSSILNNEYFTDLINRMLKMKMRIKKDQGNRYIYNDPEIIVCVTMLKEEME